MSFDVAKELQRVAEDSYKRGYNQGVSDTVGRIREFALHEISDPAGPHTWHDDLNPEGFVVS